MSYYYSNSLSHIVFFTASIGNFLTFVTVTRASEFQPTGEVSTCGSDSVPFSILVDLDGRPKLSCDNPACFDHQNFDSEEKISLADRKNISSKTPTPFLEIDQQEFKHRHRRSPLNSIAECSGKFENTACELPNEWTGSIAEVSNGTHIALHMECCTYEKFDEYSKFLKSIVLKPGERFVGGPVLKNDEMLAFDIVKEIRKNVTQSNEVRYVLSIYRMICLKMDDNIGQSSQSTKLNESNKKATSVRFKKLRMPTEQAEMLKRMMKQMRIERRRHPAIKEPTNSLFTFTVKQNDKTEVGIGTKDQPQSLAMVDSGIEKTSELTAYRQPRIYRPNKFRPFHVNADSNLWPVTYINAPSGTRPRMLSDRLSPQSSPNDLGGDYIIPDDELNSTIATTDASIVANGRTSLFLQPDQQKPQLLQQQRQIPIVPPAVAASNTIAHHYVQPPPQLVSCNSASASYASGAAGPTGGCPNAGGGVPPGAGPVGPPIGGVGGGPSNVIEVEVPLQVENVAAENAFAQGQQYYQGGQGQYYQGGQGQYYQGGVPGYGEYYPVSGGGTGGGGGGGGGGMYCFSGEMVVRTVEGIKPMRELDVGDLVLTIEESLISYSPVIMFLHKKHNENIEYLHIHTETSHSLKITDLHLIWANNCQTDGSIRLIYAKDLRVGDCLHVISEQNAKPEFSRSKVVRIDKVHDEGYYAPLTANGNIIVNDVLASCHSNFAAQTLQHTFFIWWRKMYSVVTALNDFSDNIFSTVSNYKTTMQRRMNPERELPFGVSYLTSIIEIFVPPKLMFL